ncbi:uncharacterized protein LOC122363717 [Amphibalanus amphitrite]|uniref:uncharacterized protein LOC122363717 n=1 Tax=Amphibalanus amphitrite TaxID=1232801 RepID=UPI001C92B320|nr:uncharacterized protein LOC122363717 [Amphibalanus amphitrite]
MSEGEVAQVDIADVDPLLKELETLGALSAKIRCLLLLLKNGVNKSRCHIFAIRSEDGIAAVVVTESAPGFQSLSAVTPNTAEGHRQMAALLRWPALAELLWAVPFRADFVPLWLGPLLASAAAEQGARWWQGVTMQQFSQSPGQPLAQKEEESSPGIVLRPLDANHFDIVKHYWPYAARAADADAIIRDGLLAGLSMGAFVDGDTATSTGDASTPTGDASTPTDDASTPTGDGLVSWCVLNHNGSLAFMHTMESHRRQGLGGLVLGALTRLLQQRGYPCSASTVLGPQYGTRALQQLGYTLVGDVLVGGGGPATDSK